MQKLPRKYGSEDTLHDHPPLPHTFISTAKLRFPNYEEAQFRTAILQRSG